MVDVARLVKALEALVWKRGLVSGPGVKHEVRPDGDHVITILVPKALATWTAPPVGNPKANYPSAGWDPPKK